jgi:anti-sigma factor RsiW
MTCRQVVELVTDYLEGVLPREDAARFERHLGDCFWCTRYVEQMRVTIATVGRIDEASLSPEAERALLNAFRDWNAERQSS